MVVFHSYVNVYQRLNLHFHPFSNGFPIFLWVFLLFCKGLPGRVVITSWSLEASLLIFRRSSCVTSSPSSAVATATLRRSNKQRWSRSQKIQHTHTGMYIFWCIIHRCIHTYMYIYIYIHMIICIHTHTFSIATRPSLTNAFPRVSIQQLIFRRRQRWALPRRSWEPYPRCEPSGGQRPSWVVFFHRKNHSKIGKSWENHRNMEVYPPVSSNISENGP